MVEEGAVSSQPAILKVCADKDALGIQRWAEQQLFAMQKKVRECMSVDDSSLVSLGDYEQEMEGDELPADLFGCGVYGL